MNELALHGCTPEPLMSYLKALGAFLYGIFGVFSFIFDFIAYHGSHLLRRQKDADELRALGAHRDTNELLLANAEVTGAAGFPQPKVIVEILDERYLQELKSLGLRIPIDDIRYALITIAAKIFSREGLHRVPQRPAFADSIEEARYRDQLIARFRKISDPRTLKTMIDTFAKSILEFTRLLPPSAFKLSDDQEDDPPLLRPFATPAQLLKR